MPGLPKTIAANLNDDDQQYLHEREQRIKHLARVTAASIVEIGGLLIEVKERVGHGNFLAWIQNAFQWSRFTADRFMNVHEQFKCSNLQQMEIDVSALYLLAAPKTPEPVRTEVIRRAEAGEQVTHEQVKILQRKYEETGELPESVTTLVTMATEVKKEQAAKPLPSAAKTRKIHEAPMSEASEGPVSEWDDLAEFPESYWQETVEKVLGGHSHSLREFIYDLKKKIARRRNREKKNPEAVLDWIESELDKITPEEFDPRVLPNL